jgi:hypothetical protein
MNVKADRDEASQNVVMLGAQDAAEKCKTLGINGLHIKLRAQSGTQALEYRITLFPHLVLPAIMVWIFVWKYIIEPFIHILQHFVLQLSRSIWYLST